jgi:hypothetical protein
MEIGTGTWPDWAFHDALEREALGVGGGILHQVQGHPRAPRGASAGSAGAMV